MTKLLKSNITKENEQYYNKEMSDLQIAHFIEQTGNFTILDLLRIQKELFL